MADSSNQEVCKPCPHDNNYYNGWRFSSATCPLCLKDAEIERLRAALEQYGRHDNGCPSVDSHKPCTCGFAQFCVVCRRRAGVETVT